MTHSEAIEADFLPNMSDEEQKRFTSSELILYKHALEYKWTVEQRKKVIAMLRLPEFDFKEIDTDLRKRMEKAVLDGRIKCFNMREGPADGKDHRLRLHHACIAHVVEMINRFGSEDKYLLCADSQVQQCMYEYI